MACCLVAMQAVQAQVTTDTLQQVITDTADVDDMEEDEYHDPVVRIDPSAGSYRFVPKEMQGNGGGPEMQPVRILPDSIVKNWQQQPDFWYVSQKLSRPDVEQESPESSSGWSSTLLWVVAIAAFSGFLVWYLANNRILVFRRGSRKILAEPEDESMPDDIFSISYQREIEKAVKQENYRLAVRLIYLQLLTKMADRQIIRYKPESTNFDYLLQLKGTSYYPKFFRATRHYEFSWYGSFDVSAGAFAVIRADMQQLDKLL